MTKRRPQVLDVVSWLVYAFLIAPVFTVLLASVSPGDFVSFPPSGFTLRWYAEMLEYPEFMQSLGVSLVIASVAAIIATLLGALAALAVVRYNFAGKAVVQALLLSPLLIPSIVTAIALFQFLMMVGVGVSVMGLMAGHLLITIPYTIRLVTASLVSANPHLERAALNLGASPVKAFFLVTLPVIRPGLIGGMVLAFLISFDDVTISLFLSTPNLVTLPVRIFTFIDQTMSPMVTAVSSIMIIISFGAILLVERVFGLRRAFITAEERRPISPVR